MTLRERRLALLLASSLAAAAATVGLSLGLERIGDARKEISDCRRRIERLSRVSVDEAGARARLRRIDGLVERAEGRAAAAAKLSMSAFGREVKDLLAERGLSPEMYRLFSEGAVGRIEMGMSCAAADFLRFLKSATETKGWSVVYLSMRADPAYGRVDAVVRLGR